MQKDEILDRLVFSDAVAEAYAKMAPVSAVPSGDHWSRPVLLERAAYLRKLARLSEGWACETIRQFPGYSLMLMVLVRSGDAVIDENHADILSVLDGQAILATGGTLERPRRVSLGKTSGTAISGGSTRKLLAGDVIHLAPGVPHQLLLGGDRTISLLISRVTEAAESR